MKLEKEYKIRCATVKEDYLSIFLLDFKKKTMSIKTFLKTDEGKGFSPHYVSLDRKGMLRLREFLDQQLRRKK